MGLKKRLVREYERLEMVKGQIKHVEAERGDLVRTSGGPDVAKVRQLLDLRGIGINSSWLYVMEFFWVAGVSQPSGGGGVGRSCSDTPSEWR